MLAALIIGIVVAIVSTVVTVATSVDSKNSQEESARRAEQLQSDQSKKAEARLKGQSEINKATILKNLRKTREEFAAAATYERLVTERLNRQSVKKRQEAAVSGTRGVEKTVKPSLRSQGTGYSRGVPWAK